MSTPFKMKGSPFANEKPSNLSSEEKLNNLRKHRSKYAEMSPDEKSAFNEAWTNAGGKTKKIRK